MMRDMVQIYVPSPSRLEINSSIIASWELLMLPSLSQQYMTIPGNYSLLRLSKLVGLTNYNQTNSNTDISSHFFVDYRPSFKMQIQEQTILV